MAEDDPLSAAVKIGDADKVKALIDSGADVSCFDGDGLTPLMHAARLGHAAVVRLLLEAGAPWNALSPSNLSAGDFAMDCGHHEAFDLLLRTGIEAELILGTIARKTNAKGGSDGVYLEDRVSFSEDKLMDSDSKAIMMAWERPLMEAHAKAVCSGGGQILNIGFGMGLVDTAIQQYSPVRHTIVEAHPEVYDRMLRTGWGEKKNVKIISGRWQDVLSQLDSYDGIFFDTYGEYYEDLREFHQHLPTLLKPGGIYSFFNGLCGVPPLKPKPSGFADERLAAVYPVIQNFKAAVTSDPLGVTRTWTGPDVCGYRGFYCDGPPDNRTAVAVASVDFNGFRLSAPTLVGFLDRLPDIALFHANSNDFGGSIPPAAARLPYLYELDLSNNRLSGPFPEAVAAMASLTFLDLRFNRFTGSVPPQIFDRKLDFLFLNDNGFTQSLPDSLGDGGASSRLVLLTLANNRFTGPIPGAVPASLWPAAAEILLLNNEFSGCLPYEIGFLKDAAVFDAGNNRLTGPLPFSVGCMDAAEQLNFAGNSLYGAVPEVACGGGWLGSLANLSLSENYFTALGPACRELVRSGVVDIRKNCVPGLPDQRSPGECAAFFAVPRVCPRMETYTYIPCKKFPPPFPFPPPPFIPH